MNIRSHPTSAAVPPPPSLSPYQRRLIVFLSVATFFEGFDFLAVAQILPSLRAEMALDAAGEGLLIGFINCGTVLAYVLVRKADHWGRRRVLTVTIAGYTTLSFATAFTHEVYGFALCQLGARLFLIGEWAVAMVYAAEEFPADRRGMAIGVIQAASSLGAIACAGAVPLLLRTALGWRGVFVVGSVPLLVMAVARRNLRETARFAAHAAAGKVDRPSLFRLLRPPYAARTLQLALIWSLTYACTQTAITFWKEYAVAERGLGDAEVGATISVAALVSMPLIFAAGRMLDVLGRRRGAMLIYAATALGVLGSYSLRSRGLLGVAMVLQIFGASSVLPVLNAFTAELFPTAVRADAFAWSNNLLGRLGYVLAPLAVGAAAGHVGWGRAVSSTVVCLAIAAALIVWLLPETRGRELEDIY